MTEYKERLQYRSILFCISAYVRQMSVFDFPSHNKISLFFDI